MASFQVETKNKVDIDKKPRVYFTCHPDDFEKYFKKVCDDIFKTHDCAIYYTEDMTEMIPEEEKQVDLGRNHLFVIPVTFKLLSTANRAMDGDIPYALKAHIPVLPIMMEPGLDEFYAKPDKFGELQYLTPYSTDLTEISYEEKLKKYLDSVLISDELAKRVRAAFDAYIFLSYRKKDRKYANELMRLIHSNPQCRDIAIWFDEFLTPGESFRENIEKMLNDCRLFALLVTPQILEKVVDQNGEERENYVISTELPLARKKKEEKGIDILAVEMEDTCKDALSALCIEDLVNIRDEAFRTRLTEAISKIAVTTDDRPEHSFLIGLAYLEGIDMEVDSQRSVELISFASQAGLIEATEKLISMYQKGIGVSADPKKAIELQDRLSEQLCAKYEAERSEEALHLWFDSVITCVDMCSSIGLDAEAKAHCAKAEAILNGERAHFAADWMQYASYLCHSKKADILREMGILEPALDHYLECTTILLMLSLKTDMVGLEEELCRTYSCLALVHTKLHQFSEAIACYRDAAKYSKDRESLAQLHAGLAKVYKWQGDFPKTMEFYEKARNAYQRLWEDTQDDFYRYNLAAIYALIGQLLEEVGQLEQTLQMYFKAIEIKKELVERTDTYEANASLARTYSDTAIVYSTLRMYNEALAFAEQALQIRQELAYQSNSVVIKKELSDSCNNMGSMLISAGHVDAGVKLLHRAVEIREELAGATQTLDIKLDLCVACDNLGNIYRLLKKPDEALKYFTRSLEIVKNLSTEGEDRGLLYQQACSWLNIGVLNADPTCLEDAYHRFAALAGKYPDVEDYARRRDFAKKKLDELKVKIPVTEKKESFFTRLKNKRKK